MMEGKGWKRNRRRKESLSRWPDESDQEELPGIRWMDVGD